MRIRKCILGLLVGFATVGLVLPLPAICAAVNTPLSTQSSSRDVILAGGGVLHGQLLDDSGHPVIDEIIALFINSKEVARSTTDREGRFGFRNREVVR